MTIFGKEPVAWVGVIAAVAIAVIQTLNGQGIISDVLEGRAIDATNGIASVVVILLPLVLNVLAARPAVTPVAAPSLPAGTQVTVIQPGSTPNTTATV